MPNKPDAASLAIESSLHARRRWREVADLDRWPMKTTPILALLLGLMALEPNSAKAQHSIKVSLVSCEGYYVGESSFDRRNVAEEPERFLKDKSREPVDFLVLIENTSGRDIAIYRQWNSWGYKSVHFVVEGADGKQAVIEKGMRAWTKNYPDYFWLRSGMAHAFPICFSSKEWKGVEALSANGARLKAVFQQKPLDDGAQIFTNRIDSTFVVWETLTRRKAN